MAGTPSPAGGLDPTDEDLALMALSDEELVTAWHATPSGPKLDLICGEFERRGLDEPMPW